MSWAYLEVYVGVSSMTPMLQDFLLYRPAVNRRRAQDAAPPRRVGRARQSRRYPL
jgi:hypothetical protein